MVLSLNVTEMLHIPYEIMNVKCSVGNLFKKHICRKSPDVIVVL